MLLPLTPTTDRYLIAALPKSRATSIEDTVPRAISFIVGAKSSLCNEVGTAKEPGSDTSARIVGMAKHGFAGSASGARHSGGVVEAAALRRSRLKGAGITRFLATRSSLRLGRLEQRTTTITTTFGWYLTGEHMNRSSRCSGGMVHAIA